MRPLWERTVTWGIADHLRRGGMGEASAYRAAALVVRDLDRRNNLMAEMARYPLDNPGDVDDPTKSSARLVAVLQKFWKAVASADVRTEAHRILDLAVASMMRSGTPEIAAAAALAQDAVTVEAWNGRLGQEWAGLGALRDDVGVGGADVLAMYDALVRQTTLRKAYVKEFQTWSKGLGWYSGKIDGIWGDKSEAAFVHAVPMAAGRASAMTDVIPLRPSSGFDDSHAFGTLITRDLWLASNPAKLAAEAPPAAPPDVGTPNPVGNGVALDPSGEIVVSYPKPPAAPAAPGGGSQIVVTSPKPPAVVPGTGIVAAAPSTRAAWIGGGIAAAAALTALGVWLAQRRKEAGR